MTGAPVNILLVDDRPNNLVSLKALLDQPDYNLVLAYSGQEALALVLREDFALILMDVAMPGMDGLETARILKERERTRRIPIIFVTAAVWEAEDDRGYSLGAVDYLAKPINPHAVRAKVAVFVELYRQRQQIEDQARQLREAEDRAHRLLQQQAERALHESEALYRMTFEEAPVGIGQADAEGRWKRANRRLTDLFGADLIGRPVEALGAPSERPRLAAALQRLREGRDDYSGEHPLAAARGAQRWGALTFTALRDPAGEIQQIIVVVEDITERIELVQRLEEGIRSRDDFLAIAAHELRTPLTPLRLQAAGVLREAQRRQGAMAADLVRRLKAVDAAAARLEALVDRLVDVPRLSTEQFELAEEELELSSVARDAIGQMKDQAERAGCAIELDASRPVLGRWDRVRLEQAMTNLLSNAIKFGRGKPITVRVEGEGGLARLSVQDRGPGIPLGAQHHLFERFGRASPVQHFGGFGLGLWTVRQIAQAHGGQVTVLSRPGEGSEFTLELPLPGAAQQPSEAVQ